MAMIAIAAELRTSDHGRLLGEAQPGGALEGDRVDRAERGLKWGPPQRRQRRGQPGVPRERIGSSPSTVP